MARRLAQSQHQHDRYAGLIGRPYEMVWGCSSAGEHFVDIEGVTGSIPVTPTISSKRFLKQSVRFGAFLLSGLCVLSFSGETSLGALFASSKRFD
jgi:hypothetical protein